jgi:hypothetical protein
MKKPAISLVMVSLAVVVATACSPASLEPSQTEVITTPSPTQPPVQVISVSVVREPFGMVVPGGPEIEVTLKNNSNEPLVSLSAFLTIQGLTNGTYNFDFGFSADNPLMPGALISRSQHLFTGRYDPAVPYPLGIAGTLRSSGEFTQENYILIGNPPPDSGPEFSLIFRYGIGAQPNELDTLKGTFTKDLITLPPVTTSLTLTREEMEAIYRKMAEIGFFSYPEVFKVNVPPGEATIIVTPFEKYYFEVTAGSRHKTLAWDDEIRNYNGQAAQLRSLVQFIKGIITAKPEYQVLPQASGGYA